MSQSITDCTELTLEGAMWFVDKWLDEEDLKEEDPVKRAIRMREVVLDHMEALEAKVETLEQELKQLKRKLLAAENELAALRNN